MILAAGRGERLRPLTDHLPKPLIELAGETLAERHLRRLAAAGITEVVVNLAHLGRTIEQRLGDGSACGVTIHYSHEPPGALETAGGIREALGMLGGQRFILVNGDVWTDFDFARLAAVDSDAHLVLVPNPPHHPAGDFDLTAEGLTHGVNNRFTYAGLALLSPALFAQRPRGRAALGPLLFALCDAGRLTAEVHRGRWFDIGSPERLEAARKALESAAGT
ncbi:MAG: N-acetylmuramate alpha-1-phosphate uridylyltransferase MurU [Gammaproteobacteria bacterium]